MQATPPFVAAIVIALCAVSHLTGDNRWLAAYVAGVDMAVWARDRLVSAAQSEAAESAKAHGTKRNR